MAVIFVILVIVVIMISNRDVEDGLGNVLKILFGEYESISSVLEVTSV